MLIAWTIFACATYAHMGAAGPCAFGTLEECSARAVEIMRELKLTSLPTCKQRKAWPS